MLVNLFYKDIVIIQCGRHYTGGMAEEEGGNNDGSGDRWHVKEAHHKRLVTFEVALKYW